MYKMKESHKRSKGENPVGKNPSPKKRSKYKGQLPSPQAYDITQDRKAILKV